MTAPDGGESDLSYKVCELRIASPYITKRMREQECLLSERKVLSPDLKESEDAEIKALKETVKCIYGPSLKYGNEQPFSFTDTWTKEHKTVNRLLKETL